jgi:hypothetical protein
MSKQFPIQRYGTIPWEIAERAWREYHRRYSDQSLEEIARRQGFGIEEMDEFYPAWREAIEPVNLLKAENQRLRKMNELKGGYCERKHAFCSDCHDKLPDNHCWRCENQRLREALAGLTSKCIEHYTTIGGSPSWECTICVEWWDTKENDPDAHLDDCPVRAATKALEGRE